MWPRETSEPRAAALCGGACARKVRSERAPCLPAAGAVAKDTTLCRDPENRRRCADGSNHCPGQRVWSLRIPTNHCAVATAWLASGQRSGTAHLASRGVEGTAETAAPPEVVAKRWVVHSATTGACESRLELRLRERDDA